MKPCKLTNIEERRNIYSDGRGLAGGHKRGEPGPGRSLTQGSEYVLKHCHRAHSNAIRIAFRNHLDGQL